MMMAHSNQKLFNTSIAILSAVAGVLLGLNAGPDPVPCECPATSSQPAAANEVDLSVPPTEVYHNGND
jgi:hypothetical protein